jgi:hypothetical protein
MCNHAKMDAPVTLPALFIVAFLLLAPQVASGGERELWSLWKKHMAELDDHAGMVSACRKYASALPGDPFLPVVRSLETWHLLSSEQTDEAVRLLSSQLKSGDDTLDWGAQRVARGWFTRLQRERMVDALQYYYRKEVRYPEKLEELVAYPGLPGAKNLPLNDAWDRPWRYRLVGFKAVSGFRDQKYKLESNSIQPPLDTAGALARPYAEGFHVEPSRVAGNAPQEKAVVKLEFLEGANKGKSSVGQVGEDIEGLTVAYAGKGLVVLCNSMHWKIITWKR